MASPSALDPLGEGVEPAGFQPEDVVAEPEVIGRVTFAQQANLGDDVVGRARVVGVAVDRLRAPVAQVRTAAGGDHVQREVPVALLPEPAVALDVHQVPGRQRQQVQILEQWARAGLAQHPALPEHQARDVVHGGRRTGGGRVEARHQLAQRQLPLADDHVVGPGGEVDLRRVGGVVARHHHPRARGARLSGHRQRRLAHPAQAHLGEPVEDVVVDHHQRRPRALQRRHEPAHVVIQHRIEERHRLPARAQGGRRRDGRQRRVGLADRVLLAIEAQQMAVGKEDAAHGRSDGRVYSAP